MIQQPKPVSQYQAEILQALVATGIRQTAPGAKARAFCDIIGDKLGELEVRSYAAMAQTLLPYATGTNLDFLGEMVGVVRIPQQDVQVLQADSNFKFFVRRGTFGHINNGRDILVPAGTRVTDVSGVRVYATAFDVVLPAAAASQTFTASSLSAGSAGNAPAEIFVRHNFTNYADSRYGSLLVTNQYGLVGGRDVEDDDSYRYRINLKLRSRGGAAEADLRLALLAIPGVQDLVFTREAGAYTAYVYGVSPVVPPSLLALVQAELEARTAYPLVGLAVAPDLVGVSLSTTVSFAANTAIADRSTAIAAATAAAADYLNNLRVGEMLVLNEIADRIRNADPKILDIGTPNKPLNDIFLWRARFDGSRYSRYLVGNYTPAVGERIVVETIPSAITLS